MPLPTSHKRASYLEPLPNLQHKRLCCSYCQSRNMHPLDALDSNEEHASLIFQTKYICPVEASTCLQWPLSVQSTAFQSHPTAHRSPPGLLWHHPHSSLLHLSECLPAQCAPSRPQSPRCHPCRTARPHQAPLHGQGTCAGGTRGKRGVSGMKAQGYKRYGKGWEKGINSV